MMPNIPEAVTGGLLAALATLAANEKLGLEIIFDLDAHDMLLLMRWRVSPTSVVCTMVMRAMFAPCGAYGGACGSVVSGQNLAYHKTSRSRGVRVGYFC